MKFICNNTILFIFLFVNFILISKSLITENPTKIISNKKYPIIFNDNEHFYQIITSGGIYIKEKETGDINLILSINDYSSPYFICKDENSNNFLFANKDYYEVILDSESKITDLIPKTLNIGEFQYIGCIVEKPKLFSGDTRVEMNPNTIIIYGKKDGDIYLHYISESELETSVLIDYVNIDDNISCKSVDGSLYVCSMLSSGYINIKLLTYKTSTNIMVPGQSLKVEGNSNFGGVDKHVNTIIYDTSINTEKIICGINLNRGNIIECKKLKVNIFSNSYSMTIDSSDPINYNDNFSFKIGNCYLTGFNSDYLFCCANSDIITCKRQDNNFNLISSFNINIPGENSDLTILKNIDFVTLLYMSNNNEEYNIYEYYIYIPGCQDATKEILVFQEFEINLNTLIERKTRIKHYVKLRNLPSSYGTITINEQSITRSTTLKELADESEENILRFISTNDELVQNHQLYFNISTEETYSVECIIDITIKPCYTTCKKCSQGDEDSTSEEHNCLECKENYFPLSSNPTNCYSEIEKELNWYLDTDREMFDLCDTNCKTCSGPNNNDCLSCLYSVENPLYLYNGECVGDCPLGTFIKLISEGNYICESCYENCKSCSELGNSIDMKCDLCETNDIKYNQNCYKVADSTVKSFYEPETMAITSCLQLYNLYIKENEYECISFPEEGYYISNIITGLLSPCHVDCITCSQGSTETSSNCDTCSNINYYIQEGNCIEDCSEGYYPTEKICNRCHNNCLTCTSGIIEDSGHLISMECLECKDNMIRNEDNCFPIISYTPEEIIFDISEINSEENGVSCSYFNKTIIYEEYQCIPKPNITIISTMVIRESTYEESEQQTFNIIPNNNEESQSTTNKIVITNNEELLQQISNKSLEAMINNLEGLMPQIKLGTIFQINKNNHRITINPMNHIGAINNNNINNSNNESLSYAPSTFINFGNCEYKLRNEHKIPNETILTVIQIEINNDEEKSLTNQLEYSVYDDKGKQLNLSVCSEEPIEINYIISNPELIDTEKISFYQNMGIDIFNISDEFFNDICIPYSINGSDVVLKDRINDIYQNYSMCEDNCEFKGINLTTMVVSCSCNVKTSIDTEKKDLKFDFIYSDLFTETSFSVVKCYKLVFSLDNKNKNIGFIIFTVLILVHVPIIVYYLIYGIFPINVYMMKEMEKFHYIPYFYSPKKRLSKNKSEKINNSSNSRSNIKDKNVKNIPPQNSKNDLIVKQNKKNKKHKSERINNKSKENLEENQIKIFSSKDKYNININYFNNKSDDKKILSKENLKSQSNNKEINNELPNISCDNPYNYYLIRIDANNKIDYTSYESKHFLDNFEYEEALIYDKRSFCRIYYICLLSKDNILNTFVLNTPLELKSIKLCTFIFMYSCDLALNTLFYFSDNISDKYNYKGNNIILFNIVNNLTISLASSLMSFVIIFLLQFLTNSKDSYEEVFRAQEDKMKEDKKYKIDRQTKLDNLKSIYKINRCLKVKLMFFIIIEILIMLFFYYFVCAFCEVYKNTQGSWIIDFLVSVVMNFPIEIILSFIITVSYYIGIKGKAKCAYKFAMFMYGLG